MIKYWKSSALVLALLGITAYPAGAILDQIADGMSDIWQAQFGMPTNGTADPNADPDGDGWTNLQESVAGTDPFSGVPPEGIVQAKVAPNPLLPGVYAVSCDTLIGKQYRLWCSEDLSLGSWIQVGDAEIGDGTPFETIIDLSNNTPLPNRFFWRVTVSDLDSDVDDLTDYEEGLLGTNPSEKDTDGDGYWDIEELIAGLNVLVADPGSTEGGSSDIPEGVESFIVTGDEEQGVVHTEHKTFTIPASKHGSILLLAVYTQEFPIYTRPQSEYDDTVEWTITPSNGSALTGSSSVNDLHGDFMKGIAEGNEIFGYSPVHYLVRKYFPPNDAEITVDVDISITNISDGFLPTTTLTAVTPIYFKSNEYHGNQTVKKDDGTGDYSGADWLDGSSPLDGDAEDTEDHKWPVCYIKGDTIGVSGKYTCPLGKIKKVRFRAKATGTNLKGTGANEIVFASSPEVEINEGENDIATIEGEDPINGSIVNYMADYQLKWEISLDGGSEWGEFKKADNPFYALYGQPIQASKLYRTVLHLACCHPGATTWNQVVQNTWANFSGPANVKAWNSASKAFDRPLYYYKTGEVQQTVPTETDLLLQSGNGQCKAWSHLFLDCLKIHGESTSQFVQVDAGGDEGGLFFLVKSWTLKNDPPDPPSVRFPTNDPDLSCSLGNVAYGDWTSNAGLAGQNTATPYVKVFAGHEICKYSGNYFDPSYGVTYTDEQDFEDKAIEAYGYITSEVNQPAVISTRGVHLSSIIFGAANYPSDP